MPFDVAVISQELESLEKNLVQYLLTPNETTNEIIAHIFSCGGKRLRPALFYLCSKLIGYQGEHLHAIAAVCEYIHAASLLHDDVIDNSQMRRNKPSTNSIWGDETAVLVGDLTYAAACRLMVKTQSLELIDCFAECIRFMSESELFQLDLLWKADTTRQDYLRLVSGKTACLFEASCQTPAFLLDKVHADKDSEIQKSLGIFGRNLGFVFQIVDDCLDYSQDEKTLGKPVAQDIFQGKITFPLIYALENCQTGTVQDLVQKVIDNCDTSDEIKRQLVERVNALGVPAAMDFCQNYLRDAQQELEKVYEKTSQTDGQKRAFYALSEICRMAIERQT